MHLKHFHSLSSEFRCDDDTQLQDAWGGGGGGGGEVGRREWGGGGGGADWALLLDLSELPFASADVLLLVDDCFVLLPFSSTELL